MKFIGMGRRETQETSKQMMAPLKGLSNASGRGKIEVATITEFLEGALIINDNRLPCLGR